MSSVEVVDNNFIVEFRGRGLVSSEPDASTIVLIDNTQNLEQSGLPLTLDIPDNTLIIEVPAPTYSVQTLGIQGAAGKNLEDSVLDDDVEVDFLDDNNWYTGYAQAGSDSTSAVWKIKYTSIYNSDGDTTKKWADGSALYNKVWDDRATYVY